MNSVILMGRLTRDPEIKSGTTKVARYSLAVDRPTKNTENSADFINCVAFNGGADFVEKYLHKGSKVLVSGRLQTGSYTNKDGQKVYTVDVIVNSHEFAESRGSAPTVSATEKSVADSGTEGFMSVPDNAPEEGLPFS